MTCENCERLTKERDEARDWVRRMHRESQTITCVYCGKAYPPRTPTSGSEALTAHIKTCDKHPMRALESQLATERERAERAEATLSKSDAALRSAFGWLDGATIEGADVDARTVTLKLARFPANVTLEADVFSLSTARPAPVKYGCHCDLDPDAEPDGCVLDESRPQDCVCAKKLKDEGKGRDQCEYWMPISQPAPAGRESGMVVKRWIMVQAPGQTPTKKSPVTHTHALEMLRELSGLYPQNILTLIELAYNGDLWLTDGHEALSIDDEMSGKPAPAERKDVKHG